MVENSLLGLLVHFFEVMLAYSAMIFILDKKINYKVLIGAAVVDILMNYCLHLAVLENSILLYTICFYRGYVFHKLCDVKYICSLSLSFFCKLMVKLYDLIFLSLFGFFSISNFAIIHLISKFLLFILLCINKSGFKKFPINEDDKFHLISILFSLLSISILRFIDRSLFINQRWFFFFVIYISFITMIFQFFLNYFNQHINKEVAANIQIGYMEKQLETHKMIEKQLQNIEKTKHDIRHDMLYINSLLHEGDVITAMKFIEDGDYERWKIHRLFNTKLMALNIALNERSAYFQSAGFNLKISIDDSIVPAVSEAHLHLILSNLLENAIRHINVENKKVIISVISKNKNWIFKIENSCSADEFTFGTGLESVQYVVEKNRGNFTAYKDGNMFIACVVFPTVNMG